MADASSKKFQAPKGTRDFYPADLAVRRHIENVWRQTSINHGFEEIDGPTFEHLDLYTHKSGPGIASELFQVFSGKDPEQIAALKKDGGLAPYALRPEFTPTLARMVAARAPELPRPIKWFAIPSHFRAESPQRGRLREFMQWNVDFIGIPESGMFVHDADVQVIQVAIDAMRTLGLSCEDVRVKIAHRGAVAERLAAMGRQLDQIDGDLAFLDERAKLSDATFRANAHARGWSEPMIERYSRQNREIVRYDSDIDTLPLGDDEKALLRSRRSTPGALDYEIRRAKLEQWCEFDSEIVRGLAYYTGVVFEIHEASGAERAIAGGGRYDRLIESFGGPSLPACGFGMGDVVLANILKDKGLLKPAEEYMPRPNAFVIAANDDAAAHVPKVVTDLRRQNLHVRQSYKATRNVGKLLGDAGKCRARYAVILGSELAEQPPRVALKNLDGGEQETILLADVAGRLRGMDAKAPSTDH